MIWHERNKTPQDMSQIIDFTSGHITSFHCVWLFIAYWIGVLHDLILSLGHCLCGVLHILSMSAWVFSVFPDFHLPKRCRSMDRLL